MKIITIMDIDEIESVIYEECEMYEITADLEEDRILVKGPLYRLNGTDIIIAEGTYCAAGDDGELEPDFSISLIYRADGMPDLNKPLYWEQDPPSTTLHNYMAIQNAEMLRQPVMCVA